MKRILTEIKEVYAVFNRRHTDESITLMWIETSKEVAEQDCMQKTNQDEDWFYTCERIYGNVLLETME